MSPLVKALFVKALFGGHNRKLINGVKLTIVRGLLKITKSRARLQKLSLLCGDV